MCRRENCVAICSKFWWPIWKILEPMQKCLQRSLVEYFLFKFLVGQNKSCIIFSEEEKNWKNIPKNVLKITLSFNFDFLLTKRFFKRNKIIYFCKEKIFFVDFFQRGFHFGIPVKVRHIIIFFILKFCYRIREGKCESKTKLRHNFWTFS